MGDKKLNTDCKFKIWDKKDKVLREVTRIYFDKKKVYCAMAEFDSLGLGMELNFEDIELLQYTGFKDIKDLEIYAGHVVKDCHTKFSYQVIYNKEIGAFTGVLAEPNMDIISTYHVEKFVFLCYDEFEIVGDIYNNPELITKVTE